jgi:hypothetical protein
MDGARTQFLRDAEVKGEDIVELMEITMRNLLSTGTLDHHDFLARADSITAVGKMVLISNYAEYYKLAAYLQRYTKSRIGIVLGVPNVKELFDTKYYDSLEGGILESFGRLFKNDLKLYVYPFKDEAQDKIVQARDIEVPEHLTHLFRHLMENGYIEPIEKFHAEYLSIFSRAILAKLRARDSSWEKMVPPEVAACIKENQFFGYQE